ncbi:MAG: hypothetical protein WC261_12955 [Synergistaceae bacterium]|jgi:hypothetical protein|nr:hypothetical protein [Dehalococcoidia bacterium]
MTFLALHADLILTICSLLFAISQLRQILYARKLRTSGVNYFSIVMFSVVVWTMAATYLGLGLQMSGYMVAGSASLWSVMLVQRWRYGK